MIQGIDVSHYQGGIDWAKVSEHGIQFAYIKASEGSGNVDLTFRSHWEEARKVGIIVGPYHYMRTGLAELQCSELFYQLAKVDRADSLPIALDIEDAAITLREVQALVARLRDYHDVQRLVLYLDRSMAKQLAFGGVDLHGTMNCALWLAEYDTNCTVLPVAPWTAWTFWQYGSARIPGVNVPVDQDCFKGTLEELKGLCV